ncbi:hypothetical protein LEMLEM_LOCUS17429 [Lemmus lemmus]
MLTDIRLCTQDTSRITEKMGFQNSKLLRYGTGALLELEAYKVPPQGCFSVSLLAVAICQYCFLGWIQMCNILSLKEFPVMGTQMVRGLPAVVNPVSQLRLPATPRIPQASSHTTPPPSPRQRGSLRPAPSLLTTPTRLRPGPPYAAKRFPPSPSAQVAARKLLQRLGSGLFLALQDHCQTC